MPQSGTDVAVQVYYVAKQCSQRCTPEEYAIALAKHFVTTYPKVGESTWSARPKSCCAYTKMLEAGTLSLQVSKAKVTVEEQPWKRLHIDGTPHDHGKYFQQDFAN